MYDDVAKLITYETSGRDKYGNPTVTRKEAEIYVMPRGVYASEFYNASQLGQKPSITFQLANREDYGGQDIIEYEGVEYNVIRSDWSAQRDGLSLICEKRIQP